VVFLIVIVFRPESKVQDVVEEKLVKEEQLEGVELARVMNSGI